MFFLRDQNDYNIFAMVSQNTVYARFTTIIKIQHNLVSPTSWGALLKAELGCGGLMT